MRSKLFVPAARPELFAKALAGAADAISFDLEDSVPDAGKAAARARLAEYLASPEALASDKVLIVRINGFDSGLAEDDLAALGACAGRIVINLPKVEAPDTVVRAAGLTGARLLVNIETPKGLRRAAEIGAAHSRVIGLQAGLNDLFASLGAERGDAGAVRAALWQLRLAAGEAGCFAYDGAWPDLADEAGFRTEAELARGLGYVGKSCIHPRQVPIANAVFDRGDRLAHAERLVAAAEHALAAGRGAFVFEGWMVDKAMIEEARERLRTRGKASA